MPVENPVIFTHALSQADQNMVVHACAGHWLRERALCEATHLGVGRARRALKLAQLAGRLEERPAWLASGNYPIREWRKTELCPTNP